MNRPFKLNHIFVLVQVYKAWVNCCLAEIDNERRVNDLAEDLKDGMALCQLIKLTTGHEIEQHEQVSQ